MPRLSAVIISRDVKQDVTRAIRTVLFADEVLVMDAGSAERIPEASLPTGARVVRHAFEGDGPTRRRAVAEAAHDWVLCLDADEELSLELAAAMRELLAGAGPSFAAYRFRRVTAFLGRPLMHGVDSNGLAIRLFDRRRAAWSTAPVLAEVESSGPVGRLPGAVLQHVLRDLSDGIASMDAESSLTGLELAMTGRRPGAPTIVLTAAFQFLRHYVLKQGFRDGFPGLAWAFLKAVGAAMKYLKAREVLAEPGLEPLHARAAAPTTGRSVN